jgi:hypothetical protein
VGYDIRKRGLVGLLLTFGGAGWVGLVGVYIYFLCIYMCVCDGRE